MSDDPVGQLELYRLLVEDSLGLMCIHDLDGVLLAINPAAAGSLGYQASEGVGRNLAEFLAAPVRSLFPLYLNRVRVRGSDSGLMRLVAKDGTERVWMYRNILHPDQDKALILGHALDVTHRISIERELRRAHRDLTEVKEELAGRVARRTEALEQANKELKAEMEHRLQVQEELIQAKKLESVAYLAGGIAHDFNNFLTIVQNYAQEARARLKPGDPIDTMLAEIDSACGRATRLASQLVTFGKGGAPVRRPIGLGNLVREACELALAGSNVRCEINIADDLPLVDADASQIAQVFQNILLNARQAMPEGGTVQVSATSVAATAANSNGTEGRYVRLIFEDNGMGIAPDDLSRIFDPYFTTKDAGRGLGLAAAQAIVSKHDGRISAESAVGRGTTFTIELPASPESPPAARVAAAPSEGKRRILVMDDEEAIRDILSRILRRFGYDVACASDGAEAVSLFKAAKDEGRGFSAVFLDLTVPGGVGGKEAAARIREIDSAVKAVVSSGYSDGPIMAEYRQFGFDDVLPKPWTASLVSEVVQRVLGE